MKRDMDLVRHILLEVESADDDVQLQALTFGDWTLEMVGYHVELMCSHDLVDGIVNMTGGGRVGGGFVRMLLTQLWLILTQRWRAVLQMPRSCNGLGN